MTRAPVAHVLRWLRRLPGMTESTEHGDGGMVGVSDRWIFEVRPHEDRWYLAAKLPDGQTTAWGFTQPEDLEVVRPALEAIARHQAARLSIHRLQPGVRYVVRAPFTDYYRQTFTPGQILTFRERNYLPYDGGNTVVFEEGSVYLQDSDQAEILAELDRYLAVDGS